MSRDGFYYGFSPKEFRYFLFSKKLCPKCGCKLQKEKRFVIVEGRKLNTKRDSFYVPNAKIKKYEYFFICYHCKHEFSLKELAEH